MIRDAMIDRSEAEWDALQDALGTQPGWKVGRVLSEEDIADLALIDKCHREDEEAATDAYNRGWEGGLRERGGEELVALHERHDRMMSEKNTERALRKFAEARNDELRAQLQALGASPASPAERQGTGPGKPNPDDPKDGKVRFQ